MDQERAQKLFDYGAMFLFLDVPEGTEFGMDCNLWTVGPKFRGVKMIPPGLHYIYFSAVSRSQGDTGPRSGFFYDFKAREVVVRFWDSHLEIVSDKRLEEEEVEKLKKDKKGMDPNLAPYSFDDHKKWISLTNHISYDLIQLLQPTSGMISSFSEMVAEAGFEQRNVHRKNKMDYTECQVDPDSAIEAGKEDSPLTVEKAEDALPKMCSAEGTQMRFHKIPKKSFPEGSTPSEITKYSLDKTLLLKTILKDEYNDQTSSLMGELQMSFVVFVYGRLFDGFEQWKQLVHLLCSSALSAVDDPQMYHDFITVLYFQIQDIPEDFFIDIVTSSNFLTSTLCSLFLHLRSDDVDSRLQTKAEKFRLYLTKRFKWNFDEEDVEDEQPQVVQLTDDQLEILNLTL